MARRPVLLRLALFTGVLVGALLLAEIGFRWFGPGVGGFRAPTFYTPTGLQIPVAEIANFLRGGNNISQDREPPFSALMPLLRVKQGYDRPRWSYFDDQGCILVQHNSRGFRDEEFDVIKPAGEFRVLAIGDSFTFGSGVLVDDAWPHVLEAELRESGSAQVINCGFSGGYSAATYDEWLQAHGVLLDPDMVIVGFCLNDMEGRPNDVPMLSYQMKDPVSYPSALLEYAVTTYKWRAARNQPVDFTDVVRDNPASWKASQEGLLNMKKTCDGNGIEFVVAVFPMLSQLDLEPYPYAGLIKMVRDFCRDSGIRCVDLAPAFVGRTDEVDLWVHPTDQHPNDVGHRIIGDGVYEFLREQELLPQQRR